MGSAFLQSGRSTDIHEFCFQAAKRTYMDCVELKRRLFADCEERHFQVSKCSDNCSSILNVGRFANVEE